jgi:hypothetical protein
MMLLSGCLGVRTAPVSTVPVFPKPTAAVGAEINPRCFPVLESAAMVPAGCIPPQPGEKRANCCPAFKGWVDQLKILEQQLNLTR